MRVIKANPGVISNGDDSAEVEIVCPRGAANNRVDNIADLVQLFGVQGFVAEDSMLYFDADGKIADAGSTKASYQALNFISQMYDEGLILNNFYATSTLGSTGYLNKYFGKTTDDGGYGFMLYDYSASTGAVNTVDVDGIGTADSDRKGVFENSSVTGVMPVVSPLTYWADNKADNTQDVTDLTNKTLKRYSEDNRALKTNSWCIPNVSDNKVKAAQLMDYLYSDEGAIINDFGSEEYWADDLFSYAGEITPQFNSAMKQMISESGTDFWSFLRGRIGATHGIGYVRSKTINYLATNTWAKIGTLNIESAIASGAIELANVKNTNAWGNSVPSGVYTAPSDVTSYEAVTAFWASDKYAATASGWVKVVVDAADTYSASTATEIGVTASNTAYTYAQVYTQAFSTRITDYLYSYVGSYDKDLLPAYATTK